MGVRFRWLLGLFVLGCDGAGQAPFEAKEAEAGSGGSAGAGFSGAGQPAGGSGGAASGAGGGPDTTQNRTWEPCGTAPYVPSPDAAGDFGVMSLSMSADGSKLASLAEDIFIWDVAPSFENSRATRVGGSGPEHPRVDLSPDGRWIVVSGDGWFVLSTESLPPPPSGLDADDSLDATCFHLQARFSPDGKWLAAVSWHGVVGVYAMSDFGVPDRTMSPSHELAIGCESIAFSPDGARFATSGGDEYDTSTWNALAVPAEDQPVGSFRDSLELGPAESAISATCVTDPVAGTYECGGYAAPFPKISPDGRWVVAGGTVVHRSSGTTRVLDPDARVGIFAPNGDVIAAGADNALTRYCTVE